MTNQEIIDALFVVAPQFKTTDPEALARINTMIELISCQICEKDYGNCYKLAYALLLAHFLYTADASSSIGGINSMSEGSLSISFNTSAKSYESTPWGRQFLTLKRTNLSHAFVTNTSYCGYPYRYPCR